MKQSLYLYMQQPNGEFITFGKLTVDGKQGEFRYAPDYLKTSTWVIDDIHYPARPEPYIIMSNSGIPHFIMDIMPDAWGQSLLKRIFAHQKDTVWTDVDYLLKAQNADHFGNLIVGDTRKPNQKAIADHFQSFVHLQDFLALSDSIRNGESIASVRYALAQTTSLGGARPKITLRDQHTLYLAKPKDRDDMINTPRAEFCCLQLAQSKGLNVAIHRLEQIEYQQSMRDVLILERFDRAFHHHANYFQRIPMMSGLTLLHTEWKTQHQEHWSYPRMANEMARRNIPKEDIHELYKRMLLNILIGNDDDHPKNHAFMYQNQQWRLAPLFDIVPNTAFQPKTLSMNIGSHGRTISRENVLSLCHHFLLDKAQAESDLQEVMSWTTDLQKLYKEYLTQDDYQLVTRAMTILD